MTVWAYNDGGRVEAGFKGEARDCATRAVAIATGLSYREVFTRINELSKTDPYSSKRKGKSDASTGVHRITLDRLFAEIGWTWVATMRPGSGCKVHLLANELPDGNIVARCSRHYVAVIKGIVQDTHDPTREGTRCVYGYWHKDADNA